MMDFTDPDRPRTIGWLVWNKAEGAWRAHPSIGTTLTDSAGQAQWYPGGPYMKLSDDEILVPFAAVSNIEYGPTGPRARGGAPATQHTEQDADRFVTALAGILDGYAGLADHVLDRHFRLAVCGWETVCEGRTVADVFADVLEHIRTDHP